MTDPIADYLTRLRNAIGANHRIVEMPSSNLKKEITKVLHDQGYIQNYKFVDEGPQGTIKVALEIQSGVRLTSHYSFGKGKFSWLEKICGRRPTT